MSNDAHGIRAALRVRGYAVVRPGSLEGFHSLCGEVGSIAQTRDVRIVPGGTQYPELPDAVPFHTDHPDVPVVAWFCINQDEIGGETLLIDARAVVAKMNRSHIDALQTFPVPLVRSERRLPCIQTDPFHAYWLPAFVEKGLATASPCARAAVNAFASGIADARARGEAITVRLRSGEALFLDNWTMLHGRDAIPPGSTRHLIRNYVTLDTLR